MCPSAPSFFGLPPADHPQFLSVISDRRKTLFRELYEVVFYGKVGSFWDARRMPTEIRRFWVDQVIADRNANPG